MASLRSTSTLANPTLLFPASQASLRSIKQRRSEKNTAIAASLIQRDNQSNPRGRNRLVPTSSAAAALSSAAIVPPPDGRVVPAVLPESQIPGLAQFLDTLKFDSNGMLVAIVQVSRFEFEILFFPRSSSSSSFFSHLFSLSPSSPPFQHIDTGELLMQAFADRAAVSETLQTGLATFRSRSRGGRWCKGETSGAYLFVSSVHADCDGDSLVYLSEPAGPACHTGSPSCWFSVAEVAKSGDEDVASVAARAGDRSAAPLPTLLSLERTIAQRAAEAASANSNSEPAKPPSWTAKLLADPKLLCSKVREEADELARALEDSEGKERVASEAADLLYHAAVLLNAAGVQMEDVGAVLRKRFGTSGVVEKASRKKK